MKIARSIGGVMAAMLILMACGSGAETPTDYITVGEQLKITVIEGSARTDSCDAVVRRDLTRDITQFDCVAMPSFSEPAAGCTWETVYVDAAKQNGWAMVGGAANVFWFEKPANEDCNYKLGLMGALEKDADWNAYMRGDEPGPNANLVFVFFELPEGEVCGDPRDL